MGERLYLSTSFPDVEQAMFPILEMASEASNSPLLPQFRRVMIEKVLSAQDIMCFSHRNGIALLRLVLKSEGDMYVFCEKQGPQKLTTFPTLNGRILVEDANSSKTIKGALDILLQSTKFLLDKDENGIKELLNQQWETKVSFLPALFGFVHWLDDTVLELTMNLLYNLARLDTKFFEALLQQTHQEHQSHTLVHKSSVLQRKTPSHSVKSLNLSNPIKLI